MPIQKAKLNAFLSFYTRTRKISSSYVVKNINMSYFIDKPFHLSYLPSETINSFGPQTTTRNKLNKVQFSPISSYHHFTLIFKSLDKFMKLSASHTITSQ
jgi:hypothetical protein